MFFSARYNFIKNIIFQLPFELGKQAIVWAILKKIQIKGLKTYFSEKAQRLLVLLLYTWKFWANQSLPHLEILGKSKPSLKAFYTLRNSKIKIKTRRDSIWFFLDHHWNINLFLNETLKLPLPQALSSIPRTFYPLNPLVQVYF